MARETRPDARFHVTHEESPNETLLIGLSQFGLAGLTAVDYLVTHLELTESGHIDAEQIPSITPFSDGQPRHHTRLYSSPELDVTVLVGELFVPIWAAESLSNAILDWTDQNGVEEIALLAGIPLPHGPDDHRTFYVATDDYREQRLTSNDVQAMGTGFLDGINAALVERGMTSELAVGVFVTPVHARTPDVDAAVRLVETIDRLYDIDVDAGPLQAFASDVQQHYANLSERIDATAAQDLPEDRMYM